ncbi:NAD-dependent epimerase/dehydratase family protein [Tenacibaculum agarivorans]|uniref:NAD-dependent epimerase/dehydratase family protein n=1 Tax=Tenacibaculum agarivorans TaxID=1908389 RepID=UPI00094B88EB|nr:NAD-dependent epimerase/dehydratase family protein [Tenacibaculum agarivorans]
MSKVINHSIDKSKVLVTGLTGFVGSNLKEYLNNDYEVIGVSRKKTLDLITYNDLNVELLNKSKAFIHLAGKAHDLKNTANDEEYFEVNTELTKKIFDTFLNSNCEIFIYMSSVKAVADEIEGELLEDYKPSPVTVYGKSKLAAENYILSKKVSDNKRVFILRPCMIHGPNNKGNLNLLYSFVSKGIPYPFGKYENKRSFLSIHNLSFVIQQLIQNTDISSGVYNVSDDKPISTTDLVKIIGQSIDRRVSILNIPKFLIGILAKLGDVFPSPINSEKLQKLTDNYIVSNTKLKQAMAKDLPLSTMEGITLTIKSFNK